MNLPYTTAILVVSFGTAVKETRIRTIEAIENSIRNTYPDCAHYRAWTSSILRQKVLETEHLSIHSVSEALVQIKRDGVDRVFVLPTFVTNGGEYQKLLQEVSVFRDQFFFVRVASPLLDHNSDPEPLISAIIQSEDYPQPKSHELLVFMGHGSSDGDNFLFEKLDAAFQALGHSHIFLKTMNSATAVDELISIARDRQISTITLAPFMISAGRHALRDMAGDRETSWKSRLEQAGFQVQCILKGLGENPEIQHLFVQKITI